MGCSCSAPDISCKPNSVQNSGTNKECSTGERQGKENKTAQKAPVGSNEETMGTLNLEEDSLVCLGAAIGANCVPCTVFYLKQSKMSALGDEKIKAAIEAAKKVKNTPAEHISSVIEKIMSGTYDTESATENACSTNTCSSNANTTNERSTNSCSCQE